jgi:hypothetical protein
MTAIKQKLTVMLDSALVKELKIYAINEGTKPGEILDQLISDFLRKNSAKSDT